VDTIRTGISDSATDPAPTLLRLSSVSVAFGGLLALDGIDLDVVQGERLAVLGPNGAGKTTLFNVVAGDIKPTSGSVWIRDVDSTLLPSRRRPGLGVARSYQRTRLFPGLTVEDNLYLAVVGRQGRHRSFRRTSVDEEWRLRARDAARAVWLGDRLESSVGDLSHGQQRQLEVGMAVVTNPDLMMLDEPASGLSRGERERLIDLLDSLAADVSLLLIEHDMDVALRVARRVVVMADVVTVAGTFCKFVISAPATARHECSTACRSVSVSRRSHSSVAMGWASRRCATRSWVSSARHRARSSSTASESRTTRRRGSPGAASHMCHRVAACFRH
jgi:branched-chain amino acid transport system ATP-binding protein